MNAKRLAVVAVAIVLVVAIVVLMLMPAPDDRTRTEKLILTASDLAGMNATQHSEPFPSPYHPDARNGSEAAESDFSVNVDGWYLNVQCLLVLYNSSSLASKYFQGLDLDDYYTEINAGDGCFMGGQYNETFGTPRVMRMNIFAFVLQNDTIAHFVFMVHPPMDDSPDGQEPVLPLQVTEAMGSMINGQAEKVRQGG